jgi:hypothetical protein
VLGALKVHGVAVVAAGVVAGPFGWCQLLLLLPLQGVTLALNACPGQCSVTQLLVALLLLLSAHLLLKVGLVCLLHPALGYSSYGIPVDTSHQVISTVAQRTAVRSDRIKKHSLGTNVLQ